MAQLAASSTAAAEIAGPPLDAAALRAARNAAPGPELRLDFELRQGSAPWIPIAVALGTDYVDVVEGGRETLYDFRLRRRFMIDRAKRTFTNLSLYGDVAFRRFELGKRAMLGAMYHDAAHGDELPLSLKRFWVESDVGMVGEEPERAAVAEEMLTDGALEFRFDDQEVALYAPAKQAVPLEFRSSFLHFLRLRLPLHPEIIAAIARDGRLPQRMVLVDIAGEERHTEGLVLARSQRAFADFPLPAGFEPRPLEGLAGDDEAVGLRALLSTMLDAVRGRRGKGPRPLADYRRAIDEAFRRQQGFAAALTIAEMTLQYGSAASDCAVGPRDVPCHGADELGRLLASDPRATRLYEAQTRPLKDAQEAAQLWEGLRADDMANGYVIDAFLADRLSASGHRREAMGAFAKALAGNAYLGAVYKLLGDHYLRASRTDLAWICYDIGRALPSRPKDDALTEVDELEAGLAAQYPGFF
ncbi:MAG TPA: hypothetical protein VLX85_07035 [Stellaceae bacterium]|nr:hypothetical protein [Stellaceae bacterium]